MRDNKRNGDIPRRKFVEKSVYAMAWLIGGAKILSAQNAPASSQNGVLVKALEKFFTEKADEFKLNPPVNSLSNVVPIHLFSTQQKARVKATSESFFNIVKEAWEHDSYAHNFGYNRNDLDIIYHKVILAYFGEIPPLDYRYPGGTGYARFQFEPYELVVSPKSDSMIRTCLHELSHFLGYREQLANLFSKTFCGLTFREDDMPSKPHKFSGYYEILLNKTGPKEFWSSSRSYDKLAALWDRTFGDIMTCDELQMAGYIREDFYNEPTPLHSAAREKRDGVIAEKLGIKSKEDPAGLQTEIFKLFSSIQKPIDKSIAQNAITEIKQFFGTMREFMIVEYPKETQSDNLYYRYFTDSLNKLLSGSNM